MNFIETSRLVLRSLQQVDYEAYFRDYLMDKEMGRLMCRDSCPDEETAHSCFAWFCRPEVRTYAVVLKATGKVIGHLSVHTAVPDLPDTDGKFGLGLSFALSQCWRRKGLMKEAVQAVIRHLFSEEKVEYISCGYLDFNEISGKFQENLGFQHLMTSRFERNGEVFLSVENILWRDSEQGHFSGK